MVNVNTSSTAPVPFQVSVLTANGGNWLTVNPSTGTSTGQSPGQISLLSVDATQLEAGIYSGEVDISMSGALRSVNVTVIVEPGGGTVAGKAASAKSLGAAGGCIA